MACKEVFNLASLHCILGLLLIFHAHLLLSCCIIFLFFISPYKNKLIRFIACKKMLNLELLHCILQLWLIFHAHLLLLAFLSISLVNLFCFVLNYLRILSGRVDRKETKSFQTVIYPYEVLSYAMNYTDIKDVGVSIHMKVLCEGIM
jgi:hypothetical protein